MMFRVGICSVVSGCGGLSGYKWLLVGVCYLSTVLETLSLKMLFVMAGSNFYIFDTVVVGDTSASKLLIIMAMALRLSCRYFWRS